MQKQNPLSIRARLTLAATLLALPLAAFSAPAAVTGVKAWEQDGRVHVSWDKLPDSDQIAYYRIFFSSKSILGNNGLYEDFDIADGSVSEHVFETAPATPTLFVSVLAVNDRGEESPSFVEEASVSRTVTNVVDVSAATPSEPAPTPPAPAVTENETFALLGADALSSTGVLLTFSASVTILDEHAASAFTIEDGSGTTLAVTRLTIEGSTVIVHTEPQASGTVYRVAAQNVQTARADGVVTPLDTNQSSVLFLGFKEETPPVTDTMSGEPSVTDAPAPAEPSRLTLELRAQGEATGLYTVEASWEGGDGAATYFVNQTTDHGMTFSSPQIVQSPAQGVRITGVPPGELGIRVQEVKADGTSGQTAMDFIRLGTASPLPAQILPQPTPVAPTQSGPLTQSGIGMMGALLLAGAATGLAVMRRRRMAV